jgi:anthranilate synthase component 1
MYFPDEKLFLKLAEKGNIVPVFREFLADMETPVSAFRKIDSSPFGFLLESVERGGNIGRYSFLGSDPRIIFKSKGKQITLVENGVVREYSIEGNPLDELAGIIARYKAVELPELHRFTGGAVGYISYDVIQYIEDIPQRNEDDLPLPELYFLITDTVLIFDHVNRTLKVVSNALIDSSPERAYREAIARIDRFVGMLSRPLQPSTVSTSGVLQFPEVRCRFSKQEFKQAVRKSKEYIKAGDIIQVVLSRRLDMSSSARPFDVYRSLRAVNPSPYMYYLKLDDLAIAGSSPELLVKCEDGVIETRPIAGTRPRGETPEADLALEKELLSDPKERAEHIMLVDLARNDVGRVSEFGSIRVPELMVVERYSHVMHIVSDVVGRLRKGYSAFDVLKASFPAGTLSGAPKIRAMQIIEELEKTRRGPYGGAVGYFSFSGNLDSAITIRTVVMKGNKCCVQAGAGIVADSDPEKEFQETENKARGMIKAVALAQSFG